MNDARAGLQSFGRSLLGRRPVRWRAAVLCAASTFLLTACQGSHSERVVEVRQSSERNASSEKMDSPALSTVVHRHSAGQVTLPPSSTTTVEHVFELVNDRAEAVEIRNIETNCVCIDVAVGTMHLAPGEATDVRITMEVVASGS